jgi:pantoate--beta-alanine ligase
MGALHEGHLSLVREARDTCEVVVVSVFVNPTQFGPGEDFERYPRDLLGDAELLETAGADFVFAPSVQEVYGDDPLVTVDPGPLSRRWEGEVRPGHFHGVATVVAKLLNVVAPDRAFFGEKDFQQLVIIKRMALDLDIPVEIVGMPIVRDAEGLALSSRNTYLTPRERQQALSIASALARAVDAAELGETDVRTLEALMRGNLEAAEAIVDYAAVVEPETLEPLDKLSGPARAIVAARIGGTRLIDNKELVPVAVGADPVRTSAAMPGEEAR